MTNHIPELALHDGVTMPSVGFGTYKLKGNSGAQAINHAIANGYRLIDTAYNYENEATVGEAVRRTTVPREELFITSKLPGRYHHYEDAIVTIQESLLRANLNYYDLYLIHWPNPIQDHYVEAWQALIDAKKFGYIRSIGVCNFLPEHLERLEKETGVLPTVNQIELHPRFNQAEQLKWNQNHHIIIQSWSPLSRASDLLQDDMLQDVAHQHNKTVPQIILRWHYQLGTVAIPKSANPARQKENISIFDFELSEEEMTRMNSLNRPDGRLKDQDPAVYEEF